MTEETKDSLDVLVDALASCHNQDQDHCLRCFDRLRARRLVAEWYYNKAVTVTPASQSVPASPTAPVAVAPPAPLVQAPPPTQAEAPTTAETTGPVVATHADATTPGPLVEQHKD